MATLKVEIVRPSCSDSEMYSCPAPPAECADETTAINSAPDLPSISDYRPAFSDDRARALEGDVFVSGEDRQQSTDQLNRLGGGTRLYKTQSQPSIASSEGPTDAARSQTWSKEQSENWMKGLDKGCNPQESRDDDVFEFSTVMANNTGSVALGAGMDAPQVIQNKEDWRSSSWAAGIDHENVFGSFLQLYRRLHSHFCHKAYGREKLEIGLAASDAICRAQMKQKALEPLDVAVNLAFVNHLRLRTKPWDYKEMDRNELLNYFSQIRYNSVLPSKNEHLFQHDRSGEGYHPVSGVWCGDEEASWGKTDMLLGEPMKPLEKLSPVTPKRGFSVKKSRSLELKLDPQGLLAPKTARGGQLQTLRPTYGETSPSGRRLSPSRMQPSMGCMSAPDRRGDTGNESYRSTFVHAPSVSTNRFRAGSPEIANKHGRDSCDKREWASGRRRSLPARPMQILYIGRRLTTRIHEDKTLQEQTGRFPEFSKLREAFSSLSLRRMNTAGHDEVTPSNRREELEKLFGSSGKNKPLRRTSSLRLSFRGRSRASRNTRQLGEEMASTPAKESPV